MRTLVTEDRSRYIHILHTTSERTRREHSDYAYTVLHQEYCGTVPSWEAGAILLLSFLNSSSHIWT